jgi:hypothetical protein
MSLPESLPTSDGFSPPHEIDDLCDEETAMTEITFLPDGRLCLFGASREILELMSSLQLGDTSLDSRLAALRTPPQPPVLPVNDR